MIPVRGSGDICHVKDGTAIPCVPDEDQGHSYLLSFPPEKEVATFALIIPAW